MFKKLLFTSILVCSISANTIIEQKQLDLVQSIIPGTKIKSVKPSIITGMYEAYLENDELMYVIPDKRLLFIGHIYTNTGISITQNSIDDYKTSQEDPFEKSIASLKIRSQENKEYLKELVENGVNDDSSTHSNQKYHFVAIKSLTCQYCKELDNYLKDKKIRISLYLSPGKDTEEFYKSFKSVKNPTETIQKQIKVVTTRLNGFGVPLILVIDKEYNLVDVIQGVDRVKWDKYFAQK